MKTDPEAAQRIPDEAPSCVLFVARILTIPLPRRYNDRGTAVCSTASAFSTGLEVTIRIYFAFASSFLLPIR